jgi:Domain of unknown function DUF1829/Domain of unknown function DUF1828
MTNEIQSLIDKYIAWLRDKTTLRNIRDGCVEITTPYLDRHNDYLQIYAQKSNGGIILSDDGYTIDDLELSGCNLESKKRFDLLKQTLNGFGIQLKDNRILEAHASAENFALRKHNLVQAMLAVNDLFYLAAPMVENLFFEDVISWLELSDIRFTPKVKFTGKSGYDYLYDFVIPKSKSQPERILQAVNRPTKDSAQRVILAWIDTKEVRSAESKAYAMLNDSENSVPPSVIDALRNYDVNPVLWSHREEARGELAA